ncbi:MAG: OsmC family protein [Bacteroidetes bacterium]|nr:OsmC family protein [Bacteroidota bacterium]
MATSTLNYLGGLRTEAVHVQSGAQLITDAPTDNHGKGEAFSPTDLTATSLAACILTTMGIVSQTRSITPIDGATAETTKVMYAEPRRIGEIHVKITFPKNNYSQKDKDIYERTAHTCPVAKSLHPDLKQVLEFVW